MRGVPAWHGWRSFQHPSTVSAPLADPPLPQGEKEEAASPGVSLTGLTFRARSLCVAPSFPRPGVSPCSSGQNSTNITD
ncbi:MAG: hypothetical protein EOQ86_07630 [Mesorhizobium sp.]|nr:MAG: hypothetical protein EOQ85_08150 [Mesorhizobium sp.]RWH86007.1 MAG: hypothetical protein EOQ86_07630 [Mesorhizobium sp.]RWH91264.1 MAG: hypothetical protein EOQ87_11285 [Mesorhizobium sp.]RWH99946.1 MAG: hypothetical protein EOQ88_11395 [Mesorhizobium sp.]RWI03812.1 MAG: hypothetical protein EOQ89_09520 [Mesorhizobium sp.]